MVSGGGDGEGDVVSDEPHFLTTDLFALRVNRHITHDLGNPSKKVRECVSIQERIEERTPLLHTTDEMVFQQLALRRQR